MSRSFDGVDDVITATVTAIANGDSWTVAAWIWPGNAGEGDQGVIFRCDTGGGVARQTVRFDDSSLHLRAVQVHGTTNAQTVTSTTVPTSTWTCLIVTYRASDDTCRIYLGDLDSPMAEASYASQTAGAGAQTVGGPNGLIGNNSAGNGTFSGNIALVAFAGREWDAVEIEEYRLGRRPSTVGTLRGFWPLDSPTAAQAEDLSGSGANGTVTGATVAEDPPIPSAWNPTIAPVLRPQAAGDTPVAGNRATETDTANAGAPRITIGGTQAPETDTANAGTPAVRPAGTQATETDTANAGTAAVVVSGQRADETDTANAGALLITIIGQQATETDTPRDGSVLSGNVVFGDQALETDTANPGALLVTIPGGQAVETGTGNAGALLVILAGVTATETDAALGGVGTVTVAGSRATETDTALAGVAVGGVSRDLTVRTGRPITRWVAGRAGYRWITGRPEQ